CLCPQYPSSSSPFIPPRCAAPPDLHSFPTRRSSDLRLCWGPTFQRRWLWVPLTRGTTAFELHLDVERDVELGRRMGDPTRGGVVDRKSTRLNSSHGSISYAVFCLKKKI